MIEDKLLLISLRRGNAICLNPGAIKIGLSRQGTSSLCPVANRSAPLPLPTTVPAISWPGMGGQPGDGKLAVQVMLIGAADSTGAHPGEREQAPARAWVAGMRLSLSAPPGGTWIDSLATGPE